MDTGNDQTDQSGGINVLNEKVQRQLVAQLKPLRRTMERPIVANDAKTSKGLHVDGVFVG